MATQPQPQPQPQPQATFPPTSLTIRDSDLANALESLRTTPAVELTAVRTLRIILTESNLLYWHGSLWPGLNVVFDDDDLDEYARLYPAPASSSTSSPSKELRALLRFVAGSFDLSKLRLEVNASSAAWSLFEDTIAGAYGGDIDEEWKFVYDFFMDVGRALAEVFGGSGLREVGVETSIWDGMGPWLVGQISGRGTVVAGMLPKYNDAGTRLSSGEGVDGNGVKAD
ncbi:hypothetical protein SLS63_005242 [Diaporthe eres]|uniref:Uncharacterized protein n=1 Tax=Diaporthe eres TaxID=83184 RepID=A0ABR1PC32_DIAER